MSRLQTFCASVAVSVSLLAAACDPVSDFDLNLDDCKEPDIVSDAEHVVLGSMGSSALLGVCDQDTCNGARPLGIGAQHDFALYFDALGRERGDYADFTLTSDAPDVLGLDELSVFDTLDGQAYHEGRCDDRRVLTISGRITPRKAGTARLTLLRRGQVADRYTFVVARAERLEVSVHSASQARSDVLERGVDVTAADHGLSFELRAFSGDERELFFAPEHVLWEAGSEQIFDLAPDDDTFSSYHDVVSAQGVYMHVKQLGVDTLTVSVARELTANVEVRIQDFPKPSP